MEKKSGKEQPQKDRGRDNSEVTEQRAQELKSTDEPESLSPTDGFGTVDLEKMKSLSLLMLMLLLLLLLQIDGARSLDENETGEVNCAFGVWRRVFSLAWNSQTCCFCFILLSSFLCFLVWSVFMIIPRQRQITIIIVS